MPGEVIEGHADFEGTCSSCHRPFRRQEQRNLCLDCHDHSAMWPTTSADRRASTAATKPRADVRVQPLPQRAPGPGRRHRRAGSGHLQSRPHRLRLEGRHQSADCSGCHDPGQEAPRGALRLRLVSPGGGRSPRVARRELCRLPRSVGVAELPASTTTRPSSRWSGKHADVALRILSHERAVQEDAAGLLQLSPGQRPSRGPHGAEVRDMPLTCRLEEGRVRPRPRHEVPV